VFLTVVNLLLLTASFACILIGRHIWQRNVIPFVRNGMNPTRTFNNTSTKECVIQLNKWRNSRPGTRTLEAMPNVIVSHRNSSRGRPCLSVWVPAASCASVCLSHLIWDINSKDTYCRKFVFSQYSQPSTCTKTIKYSWRPPTLRIGAQLM